MISRNQLVYIGSGLAIACVVFVGGILIGRFAIPRPETTQEIYDVLIASRENEQKRTAELNQLKKQFIELVSAKEIENHLQ